MLTAPSTPADGLLQTLLDVSLTGVILFRPLYADGSEEIIDLAYVRLNPAAQRMLNRPECPPETLLSLYPNALEAGIFGFYCDTFWSGQPGRYDVNYQHDGLDNYFQLAAQRSGDLLVVSFNDTADHARTPVEEALRESQARTQWAQTEAEAQRQRLVALLEQAPVALCFIEGPELRVVQATPLMAAMWGRTPAAVLSRPLLEAVPELAGQGFDTLMQQVMTTGVPYVGTEAAAQMERDGQLFTSYYNFVYQPYYNALGEAVGVIDVAVEVTEQVLARQQVQALNADLEARVAERTRALAAAQATAERRRLRLENLFMEAPAAICILDGPELVFELVNPACQRLFPGRVLRGLPVLQALPELAGLPVYEALQQAYRTGRSHLETEMHVPVVTHPGRKPTDFYFNYIQQARYDEHGQIDGVVVFAFEVTEQVLARRRVEEEERQANQLNEELAAANEELAAANEEIRLNNQQLLHTQHDLAREREKLQKVFDRTPALIAMLEGPEFVFTYVNPPYQGLFVGRELLHQRYADVLPDAYTQGYGELLHRVYTTGETHLGTETAFRSEQGHNRGQDFFFDFTFEPYGTGASRGVFIFAFDVTERVLARQERDTLQERLHNVFEQAPVAICVFQGSDYVLDIVNPPMTEMLGRPQAELLGRPVLEAVPELASQGLGEVLDAVRITGRPYVAQEQEVQFDRHGPDGFGYFNFTYQPLYDAQGQRTAIACVALEVTEQVLTRQQVNTANHKLSAINQQLTRTNADLDTFIYTASHDLKAPITNIDGLLEALAEQLPAPVRQAPEVRPLLRMMHQSVARFQLTIAQLTDISRLQQSQTQPAATVDLATLVEFIRLDLAPRLSEAQATFTVNVAACRSVSFAPQHLRSVVYNLLSNALKYRHPQRLPRIRLQAFRNEAGAVVLQVHDNGLGLTPAQQAQLFGLFQRLHTHVEGSGVGLYMVKKIVENAGGSISVESQEGEGSTFTVVLP